MRGREIIATGVLGLLLLLGLLGLTPQAKRPGGWGIDACLSCHVLPGEVPGYLSLLKTSGITWLRERDMGKPKARQGSELNDRSSRLETWRKIRSAGFRILAFGSLVDELPVERPDSQLPEDLLKIYQQSQILGAMGAGLVNAWELCNEPETFYMADLPDRVVAAQKAAYLGIKEGSRDPVRFGVKKNPSRRDLPGRTPARESAVLMGALAFPPGPWLELAAQNGLYDYTDAVNFHHYGFARDLTGVIDAQRAFAERWTRGRTLPLWLTEVGLNNAPYAAPDDPAARRIQAEYLVSCAEQAIQGRLAVFMPFVLVWRGSPFSLTDSPAKTKPAWEAYRDFTRQHALAADPIVKAPPAPNPVVLQWLPDFGSCTPSKTSLAYAFDPSDDGGYLPVAGEIRAYNLSATPVRVRLRPGGNSRLIGVWTGAKPPGEMILPPLSGTTWPVEFRPAVQTCFRETVRFQAETLDAVGKISDRSFLAFQLEIPPAEEQSKKNIPLDLRKVGWDADGKPAFAYISQSRPKITADEDPWLGINGVTTSRGEDAAVFEVVDPNLDPLNPPMAISALPGGLPSAAHGALRLVVTDEHGSPADVRVDVIDQDGQRFSVVENFGKNPHAEEEGGYFISFRDFHPWVFGRCLPGKEKFDPARAREIQLRFFGAGRGKTFKVKIEAVDFAEGAES